VGKVCKVEKLHSTFHTFHDYLNFCGEKKDDRLFTIYKYPRENVPEEELKKLMPWSEVLPDSCRKNKR